MKINLIPIRVDVIVEYEKRGDTLIINGEECDFSRIGEGDTLPADAVDTCLVVSDIVRENGELEFTILLPIPDNYSQEQAFPLPLLNVPDGPLNLPKPLSVQQAEVIV